MSGYQNSPRASNRTCASVIRAKRSLVQPCSRHLRCGGVARSCAVHCFTMRAIASAVSTGLACPSAPLPAAGAFAMRRRILASTGSGVCSAAKDADAAGSAGVTASCVAADAAGVAGTAASAGGDDCSAPAIPAPQAGAAPAAVSAARAPVACALAAPAAAELVLAIDRENDPGCTAAAVLRCCCHVGDAGGSLASTGKASMGMCARLRACSIVTHLQQLVQYRSTTLRSLSCL